MTGGPPVTLASRFRDVSIVVVGSAMVDQIAYCGRVPGEGRPDTPIATSRALVARGPTKP